MNDPANPASIDPYKTRVSEQSPPTAPPKEQPDLIGRYRVEKILGEGGFGLVYLAHDDQLDRPVAIKVPHSHRVSTPEDAQAYLTEARTVARLDHPHIVPVFDVGSTQDFPCFIVSKFIQGSTLARKIKDAPPSFGDATALVATVAEALHHAHRKGLVHRDIKPGNILLDGSGEPHVADFGLALKEENVGRGPKFAGTPAYMSPEQARGEGHRVDGRSDIFSLGVVFYEILTGRRPFRAETQSELLTQITTVEVRPPRQLDDTIPKELDRICLKALSKRASERYSTAKDMADDLRHFLAHAPGHERSAGPASIAPGPSSFAGTPAPVVTPPLITPPSDQRPVKIIPKGLRSFDAHDADFFLELLPGPRDRDGLPGSIRFWKTRIEETDPDNTFAVGLIYGPSGCGKSSLVKAGLLPRLAGDVIAVYIEATGDETETRLLNGLRKRCPGIPAHLGLKETLAALRRGEGIPAGKKVLIVLDQFEQWLHARKEEDNTELVQALRQCHGGRVQCVVMVRDDFWMAVTRFLTHLEIDLVQGRNCAATDLFDLDHAKKVLTTFGGAFGKLPEKSREIRKDQKDFLNLAVVGLAQEGKVICIRLALFAEMMKGRPWTPAALKEVGGTEGVGVTFLEDSFSSPTANPKHRLHQKAARAVLKALLPESGTDIKGHMRSYAELFVVSGYSTRPKDFDALIRILDSEIRLITPTDPEGQEEASAPQGKMGEKYYQMTHDYLVPSLREWLTRKEKETRRGRAELLLADRAGVWNTRPEKRQLPSLLQWLQIRWLTQKKNWTPPQRKMMRKAARYHAVRVLVAAACLILLGFVGWEVNGRLKAQTMRDRLLEATTADVPGIVKDMAPYRRWLDPLLHEAYAQAEQDLDRRKQLHASLALLPADPGQVEYLYRRLLKGQPHEVTVIREAFWDHKQDLTERLWLLLEDPKKDQDKRFRAACALAAFAPDDPRWKKASPDVAATLVIQKPLVIAQWTEALKGVGKWLVPQLADFLVDEKRSISERGLIITVYGTYAVALPDAYARLENQLDVKNNPVAPIEAKIALAKRQANVGVALLVMGRGNKVWQLLKHKPDPTVRSYLIDRIGPGGIDAKVLISRLEQEKEVSVKRAILLSLGEFGLDRLGKADRQNLMPTLLRLYRDNPDPGIHGAAEWLLRLWEMEDKLKKIDKELATGKVEGKRQWYVNRQSQTMMVVTDAGEFWMGEGPERQRQRIGRSFALASKEVTVEQFLKFKEKHKYSKDYAPSTDCPINKVTWYEAAAYCNWLSEQEGISKDQWCYEPNKEGKYAKGMRMAPNHLERTGYRLPTENEWEYACRAGAETRYSFGEYHDLLAKYSWFHGNSPNSSHPTGNLRPNDQGLFDMYGNVWEWTEDVYDEDDEENDKEDFRVVRGGSLEENSAKVNSAYRGIVVVDLHDTSVGFRPARTIKP
jgi:serine/threonine protein kinase/formylglycine-generating enzyme required for sulfatase activity